MLSARELEERNKNKRAVKKELYTRILTQMCRKIDMHYTLGQGECMLKIPEFVFGFPSFRMDHMTIYIHRQLERLGYRMSILSLGLLYAAWGPKKKPKKKPNVTVREEENQLPSLANLKKAADSLRKKYEKK